MKEKLKGIIIGAVIGALLVPTVLATVNTITKELSFNNIKITLDGTEIKPNDASGNYIEPFIMEGTTYLPVRGIASALGLDVEWDGNTNTVKLSSDKSTGDVTTDNVAKVGDVVHNNNGIKVTFTEVEKLNDSYLKYTFLIENLNDKIVLVYSEDMYVNDFKLTSGVIHHDYIQPGKKLEVSQLVQIGEDSTPRIDAVENMEINLLVSFMKDTQLTDVEKTITEKITMNFD